MLSAGAVLLLWDMVSIAAGAEPVVAVLVSVVVVVVEDVELSFPLQAAKVTISAVPTNAIPNFFNIEFS